MPCNKMPYTFDKDDDQLEIWGKILERSDIIDDCWIWIGTLENTIYPILWTSKPKKCYSVRLFVYQLFHPDDNFDNTFKIISICGNPLCVIKEHLIKISKKSTWNPEDTMKKLIRKSERLDPVKNQDIGCLIWQGQMDNHKKYGIIDINGRKLLTHVASIMVKDDITEIPLDDDGRKMVVCHNCDNKLCCEPSHLELGTYDKNNLDDRIRDGTILRNDPNRAALTEAVAQQIKLSRCDYNHPNYKTINQRAEFFGVPKHIVISIDYGKSWAHLPGPRNYLIEKLKQRQKELFKKKKAEYRKNGIKKDDYEKFREKIFAKTVIKTDPNKFIGTPCRIYTGTIHSENGRTRYKGIEIFTHVAICEITIGRKKRYDEVTRHLCGEKLCCEPSHLIFGTQSQNAIDAILQGNLKTKLTISDVQDIRREHVEGVSKQNLSIKFGVSRDQIRIIVNNLQWKATI